eukprot:Skav208778  [mRNA]  locus=scaffold2301:220603:225603:- [translate_table: standard]
MVSISFEATSSHRWCPCTPVPPAQMAATAKFFRDSCGGCARRTATSTSASRRRQEAPPFSATSAPGILTSLRR